MSIVRLGDVCQQARESIRPGEWPELRYIGLETIESGSGMFVEGELSKTPETPMANSFKFGPEHVLYGKLRPYLNKVALPDFEGKCSTEIIPLLPSADIDRAYLGYFLRSAHVVQLISARTAGARMPRADMDCVFSLQIPLPTLPEQRRIVDLLSRAEGIVRLRREAEKKAAELIPALFLDMFGDPATNPKGWVEKDFGNVTTYSRYGPRFPNREYAENGAHIVRTTDMSEDGFLRWWESPIMAVSPEEIAKYQLPARTLLITRTGTIGRVAMFMGASAPCIAGAYLLEFGLRDWIVPDYALAFFLSSYGQRRLIQGSRSVAQPNINAPTIMAIKMPIPPMEYQLGFAKRVADIRSIQSQQSAATAKAQATFDALLARVFTQQS